MQLHSLNGLLAAKRSINAFRYCSAKRIDRESKTNPMKRILSILFLIPFFLFAQTKVGIGTSTPDSTLTIVGGLRIVTGNEGAGKVLMSDGNGGASWQYLPGSPQSINSYLWEIEGQSNAVGQAGMNTIPGDIPNPMTGIAKGYDWSQNAWEFLRIGQGAAYGNAYYDYFSGSYGIEPWLMKLLHDHYGTVQYLMKYAFGGTPLYNDSSGSAGKNWSSANSTTTIPGTALYYQSNLMHADGLTALGDSRSPKALVWLQGESDAGDAARANAYQVNMQNFIAAKRLAYNNAQMWFILVRLSPGQTSVVPYRATINSAMDALAMQPNIRTVNTDDLITTDGFHYNAPSYDSIANRVYRVLISL